MAGRFTDAAGRLETSCSASRPVIGLTLLSVLQRWRAAWSKAPPPPQLQALISSVAAGRGLHFYISN